jgi:uracil DNA glycosylase
MAHHHKHHVKVHKWQRGRLTVHEHVFEDLTAALTFANHAELSHQKTVYEVETEQVIKIYDSEEDSLVHSVGSASQDATYA